MDWIIVSFLGSSVEDSDCDKNNRFLREFSRGASSSSISVNSSIVTSSSGGFISATCSISRASASSIGSGGADGGSGGGASTLVGGGGGTLPGVNVAAGTSNACTESNSVVSLTEKSSKSKPRSSDSSI